MKEDDELQDEIANLAAVVIAGNLEKYPNLRVTEEGEYFTPFFTVEELRCGCKVCNKEKAHKIVPWKLDLLNDFRILWDSPFSPNSAYRCELHPDEQKKDKPGEHTRAAMDVPLRGGAQRMKFVVCALKVGATGIGVANTFGHLDFRSTVAMLWKY